MQEVRTLSFLAAVRKFECLFSGGENDILPEKLEAEWILHRTFPKSTTVAASELFWGDELLFHSIKAIR